MNVGPLRRTTGIVGLIAMLPILFQLAVGAITPEDAALRSVVVAAVVVLLGRAARAVLTGLLKRVERRAEDRVAPGADQRVVG
jgi:hypothetical protein